MDPNECLARMLRAASEIDKSTDEIERSMLADELACLVLAMNEWIKAGGFLPAAWVPKHDTIPSPPPASCGCGYEACNCEPLGPPRLDFVNCRGE